MSRGGEANLAFISRNWFKGSRARTTSQYEITLNDRGWRGLPICTIVAVVTPFLSLVLMLVHSDGELVMKRVNVADRLLDYFNLQTNYQFQLPLSSLCGKLGQ